MIARILRRRILDEENEHPPPIERKLMSEPLPFPNTKSSGGENAATATATATATAGPTPMTPFRRSEEEGEPEARRLNTEVQDKEVEVRSREEASKEEVMCRPEKARLSSEHFETSIRHAEDSEFPRMPGGAFVMLEMSRQRDKQSEIPEPRTNRAIPEIQDIEKQLREKERQLQIREAAIPDVEKVIRVKERDLQIREAEVQKMLRAVNDRREAMVLQEDNFRQRLAALKEWEENLCLKGAVITHRMTIATFARQLEPNHDSAARGSDLLSLSSFSTIRNSIRGNVDHPPKSSSARLKQDSKYHDDDVDSLPSTTRSGSPKHTDMDLSSTKSHHARLKEYSEYYSNE